MKNMWSIIHVAGRLCQCDSAAHIAYLLLRDTTARFRAGGGLEVGRGFRVIICSLLKCLPFDWLVHTLSACHEEEDHVEIKCQSTSMPLFLCFHLTREHHMQTLAQLRNCRCADVPYRAIAGPANQ